MLKRRYGLLANCQAGTNFLLEQRNQKSHDSQRASLRNSITRYSILRRILRRSRRSNKQSRLHQAPSSQKPLLRRTIQLENNVPPSISVTVNRNLTYHTQDRWIPGMPPLPIHPPHLFQILPTHLLLRNQPHHLQPTHRRPLQTLRRPIPLLLPHLHPQRLRRRHVFFPHPPLSKPWSVQN
jgi:hypothetical protein